MKKGPFQLRNPENPKSDFGFSGLINEAGLIGAVAKKKI